MVDKAKIIRRVGEEKIVSGKKRRLIGLVKCQGCGTEIRSDEDLSEVGYVKTKRGSDLFFHRRCRDQIWKSRIPQ